MLFRTFAIAAIAALSCAASTLTYTGTGLGNAVSVLANGNSKNVFAGQLNFTVDGQSLVGFCIDLYTILNRQTYNTTTGEPEGYTNGGRAAWIVENYAGQVTTAMQAAALQLALWDVVHDGGNGLTNGSLVLNASPGNALSAAANAIVLASAGQSSNRATVFYNNTITAGIRAQTLITAASASEVPEPSTVAMLGFGAALLAVARVRRRKVNGANAARGDR